jgi:hypothetical protein
VESSRLWQQQHSTGADSGRLSRATTLFHELNRSGCRLTFFLFIEGEWELASKMLTAGPSAYARIRSWANRSRRFAVMICAICARNKACSGRTSLARQPKSLKSLLQAFCQTHLAHSDPRCGKRHAIGERKERLDEYLKRVWSVFVGRLCVSGAGDFADPRASK